MDDENREHHGGESLARDAEGQKWDQSRWWHGVIGGLRRDDALRRAAPEKGRGEGATMGRLDGKRAVITGCASGIGRATALRLAAGGARVACVDLDEDAAQAVATLAEQATNSASQAAALSRRRASFSSAVT